MIDNVIKRANWLELLFDLIFVYAISRATHILIHAHDGYLTLDQYFTFFLVMVPIWWTWTGHTLFATRFDTDDTTQRILTLSQMLAVVFWAAFINADFDPNYLGYLLFYVTIRILLLLMYWRAANNNSAAAPIAKRLGTGFSLGLIVAMLSLLFDPPIRYLVLYLGIGIEIATPLLSRKILNTVSVNEHHLPERYGLFTIILLGESVIILATTLADLRWTVFTIGAAINGFLIISAVWWFYFDLVEKNLLGKRLGIGQRIVYGHLFVYSGLSIIAVFIGFAINSGLTFVQHLILFATGFASLSVGFATTFSLKTMIKKEYLPLYFIFFGSVGILLAINFSTVI